MTTQTILAHSILANRSQSSTVSSVVIIYGPTGVGKTDFAIDLAHKVSGEIINMDVGQLYLPLTIGTAKPDWRFCEIPHHGFDVLHEPRNFSVTEYRLMCIDLIDAIKKRGNVPILVGGSGFYLKSLFFPPTINSLDNNVDNNLDQDCEQSLDHKQSISNVLNNALDDNSLDLDNNADSFKKNLWQELFSIDPIRAAEIDPHDIYRIKRALTIWLKTNKKPSEFKPIFNPIAEADIVFLTRERKDLYNRINERVDYMMNEGWLAEIESLRNTAWYEFIKKKKIIGYTELFEFLALSGTEQGYNRIRTLAAIKQKTRNYAKRQETFWRMFSRLCLTISPEMLSQRRLTFSTINMTLYSKDM